MRIAIFHTTLPEPNRKLGGVEVAVHRLSNELVKLDNDVTVFSFTKKPKDARYKHVNLSKKYKLHEKVHKNRILRTFLVPIMLNFVDFSKFDVINLHGDDWFFFKYRDKRIRTFNGSALREAQNAKTLKRKLSQYLIFLFEKYLSKNLSKSILCLGSDTQSIYKKGQVIFYGVDTNKFFPGEKTSYPSILFVGTWEGRKRGKLVYDVFVRDILPKVPNAVLYMVSDYVPKHKNVVHVEFPSDEELAKLYRQSWVFVLPSMYEGFGIPYIEAMASGTAVIATDNPGIRDIAGDYASKFVVSENSLACCILRVLQIKTYRKELERIGLLISAKYRWDSIARSYLSFLKRLGGID